MELGYFYYAVMNDLAMAVPFFQRAVALGGSEDAEKGLAEAVAELERRRVAGLGGTPGTSGTSAR
jgi:hypothetical protein